MLNEAILDNFSDSAYRKESFKKYSALSKPNWKRVGYKYEEPTEFKAYNNLELINENQQGILIQDIQNSKAEITNLSGKNEYRLGEYFYLQSSAFNNAGKYIKIESKKTIEKPLYLNYKFNENNNFLIDYNVIEIGDFSKVTIIINYNSEDEEAGYHNGIIKVVAGQNSEVKLIKVQTLNTKTNNFEASKIECFGGGKVEYYSVELGAAVNGISSVAYLEEDNANVHIHPAYLADGDRKIDLEYSLVFRGLRGNGDIQARGAVKDNSKKVFRGNLYFKRGASKSEGREGEFAILLDKTIKAHSIPTLFCDEDDVIGEHSASVGQVDESKLFYLMSRGLSEKRAKKLIVESSFKPILDNIDDEKIKEHLLDELDRRI